MPPFAAVWNDPLTRPISNYIFDRTAMTLTRFYTTRPDLEGAPLQPMHPVEIASRDRTCGWIFPCDLHLAPDGSVHLLWSERAIDERLRTRFFPEARQRIRLEMYEAGHMMYLHGPSMKKFRDDLARLIRDSDRL